MTVSLLTLGYISPSKTIVEQVTDQSGGQDPLVKTLELPLSTTTTESLGIFQSDVIIRTAIVAALADLRANPWLLNYVFSSLPRDGLTLKDYGEKEVARAKEWFLNTDIPVLIVPRIDEGRMPCISIKLQSSAESEVTLGDTHYTPYEDNYSDWPALCTPFDALGYNPATGVLTIPETVWTQVQIEVGMQIVDFNGLPHSILAVDETTITIKPTAQADFRNAIIRTPGPALITSLESVTYREVYQIGVHVSGEPVYLTWLHGILVFALLRYKQDLLEARGLFRTTFSSSDFDRNPAFESELVFSRFLSLTGYVRHYWPKMTLPKIASTRPGIKVIGGDRIPEVDPNTQLWIGENDE